MNRTMRHALWGMEWQRLRSAFILLIGGYVVLALLINIVPNAFISSLVSACFVLPFLGGLLFGSGLAADDVQDGILPLILSLPVSRSSLWLNRMLFRLGLFLMIILFWILVVRIGNVEIDRFDWFTGTWSSSLLLMVSGVLVFATGLLATTFMRNSFEAVIAAGIMGLMMMALLRSISNDRTFLIGYVVTIGFLITAARDLYICREPLEWTSLRLRVLTWMAILAILLALISWGSGTA